MTDHPFHNDADQAERRTIVSAEVRAAKRARLAAAPPLRPGDRPATTYAELANRDLFDGQVPAEKIIPKLPASSPWSDPANWGGDEPPLGGDQ